MKRGDVVLAQSPHASGTASKNRPALIVQADYYNQRIDNVPLATITGNLNRRNDPAHYFLDTTTKERQQSGLRQNSLDSCLNLAVLSKRRIGPKIGELSAKAMLEIDQSLKAALGIP